MNPSIIPELEARALEEALAYIRNSPEKESLVIAHIEMGGAGWTAPILAPLNGLRPAEFLRAVYENTEVVK